LAAEQTPHSGAARRMKKTEKEEAFNSSRLGYASWTMPACILWTKIALIICKHAMAYTTATTARNVMQHGDSKRVYTWRHDSCICSSELLVLEQKQDRKLTRKSEVLKSVTVKNVVFWNIKPYFVLHRRHVTFPLQSSFS
jgi:hypothetical protein